MAWVQIIDTDSNGATPETFTDKEGETTTMTVASNRGQASTTYFGANQGGLTNTWAVGDDARTEFHEHTFSEPVNVLRVDIRYLDSNDTANFAYRDPSGRVVQINLNQWIANGDAVLNLGAGHTLQNGIVGNANLTVIRGSNTVSGAEGGTTTIDLYFPTPTTSFIAGKNPANGNTGATDAYGYRLYYDDSASVVICFGHGTLIETQHGDVSVDKLQIGDKVRTKDNGFKPIRWIGSRSVSAEELDASPNLLPVRIKAGALGPNSPSRDLIVSPQHRILVRSKIAQRMFNAEEVLVAAKHLVELDGIEVAQDMTEVEYFHILFDQHEVIFSNGSETESLHTGEEALKALGAEARKELFTIFPELFEKPAEINRTSARPLVPGRMGRALAARHGKNSLALVCQE